ncbi:MAG: NapC/NirT family cytochrome c [Bryobacteraceae bacterium]
MTEPASVRSRLGGLWAPVVHLSNNPLSLVGVILVTTSTVFWIFLLPASFGHQVENPYLGILGFLILPAVFFLGLGLIPLGIFLRFRKERKRGSYPTDFPPVNLRNPDFRRLLSFVGVATILNIVIGAQASYTAVGYMETTTFCGRTCHTVMRPEYAAYQNSPHSRVGCVQCHIGPGASWFVRSKLSGTWQVFAVTFNTFERPIPTPVRNLRPARETCEACHWPDKFSEDRLRVIEKFGDDESNTATKSVLLMRIGGGKRGPGIHGRHLGPGIRVRYRPDDESRQKISWVEYADGAGRVEVYTSPDAKEDQAGRQPLREMDCVDCHNRPTHTFEIPERAVDHAMSNGEIARDLPGVKKKSVELLKAAYPSNEAASSAIPAAFERYYRESYPDVYARSRAEIERSGRAVTAIYNRNVFPDMKVAWGTYPNNLGHSDFPGCFRCHDDQHAAKSGRTISQDCNSCHQLLAMDEPAPKILVDLGLEAAPGQQ